MSRSPSSSDASPLPIATCLTPQYYNEVPLIVRARRGRRADDSDHRQRRLERPALLELCGTDCDGTFPRRALHRRRATGATKEFIDAFQARTGRFPATWAR